MLTLCFPGMMLGLRLLSLCGLVCCLRFVCFGVWLYALVGFECLFDCLVLYTVCGGWV